MKQLSLSLWNLRQTSKSSSIYMKIGKIVKLISNEYTFTKTWKKKKPKDWDQEFKPLWYFEWKWPLCLMLKSLNSWFPAGANVFEGLGNLVLEGVFTVDGYQKTYYHSQCAFWLLLVVRDVICQLFPSWTHTTWNHKSNETLSFICYHSGFFFFITIINLTVITPDT